MVSFRAFTLYTATSGVAAVVHPFLPDGARPTSFALFSACTLVPLSVRLRRETGGARRPWMLLLAALAVITLGNGVIAVFGRDQRATAELIVTAGHTVLLAAALALVMRRGRNDVGGLIDTSVALMGVGALLWVCVLQPRLTAVDAPVNARAAQLVTVFVLTGVLGALGRLWFTARTRLLPLELLMAALLLALVGNTVLAVTTGSMTTDRLPFVEEFFLVAYLCVGASALHPLAGTLTSPGPPPVDRLTTGRMVFLCAAIVANPVLGGGLQLFGGTADGLLIALGTLAVAPLVMLRIHRLARQREHAELALAHQATHDTLTGLPNRALIHARLDAEVPHPGLVLLFVDLNGFKPINDRLGHAAGDQLLIELGRRLGTGLPPGSTLARYGGDEFLLISRAASAVLEQHVAAALAAPFHLAGEPVTVSAAVGIAVSDGVADPDELVRRADEAMYRMKHTVTQRTFRVRHATARG